MQAGKLRHRVQFQQRAETSSASGEASESWTTIATVWAAVVPLSGTELWRATQAQAEVTHTVTVRSGGDVTRDSITPKNRILHGSRVLGVLGVRDENEDGFTLVLNCKEKIG